MSIEVGSKVEGKVTGITKFGAFVEVAEGKTGLVHISEVADQYVKDVNDFLQVGDTVTVKVLKVEDDGKIALSIKKATEQPKSNTKKPSGKNDSQKDRNLSFEDKMNRYLKDSEERLSSLRKHTDGKRGGSKR